VGDWGYTSCCGMTFLTTTAPHSLILAINSGVGFSTNSSYVTRGIHYSQPTRVPYCLLLLLELCRQDLHPRYQRRPSPFQSLLILGISNDVPKFRTHDIAHSLSLRNLSGNGFSFSPDKEANEFMNCLIIVARLLTLPSLRCLVSCMIGIMPFDDTGGSTAAAMLVLKSTK
jgi:hypothetical protein